MKENEQSEVFRESQAAESLGVLDGNEKLGRMVESIHSKGANSLKGFWRLLCKGGRPCILE